MAHVEDNSGAPATPAPPTSDAGRPRPRKARRVSAFAQPHTATFSPGRTAFWFLLPTAVVLALFLYYPMLRTVALSLFSVRFYGQQQRFSGLENYVRLVTDPASYGSIVRTVVISGIVIVGSIGIALFLAALLNQRIRGARMYRLMLIWPLAMSTAISGIVFLVIFNPNFGLVNSALEPFGIQPEWFRDRTLAQIVMIIALIWNRVGYNLVFYTAAYQTLPTDTLEAALVDGASPWQRFRHVTFPLLSPMTLFLLVTSTVFAFFDAYAIAEVFGGGPLDATSILIFELTENAFRNDRIGLAAAQSVLLFAAVAYITTVQLRQGRRRVTYQ
ncbi:sugar ABC transporter permease [Actinobacteria bacterium YIM 96077]|uniref:Sugar ABC transporter permease n=1 Tax=Phytoactinopolyspora halophila TaxID=1981511 RepID=A0A329QLT6_9ACTN|nr:sugar ABC transporter permease [Phytoactinopolyspora halophila]AYY14842.1 sugar ABC transporter permease [Actinobacteria bacterium YIM 96077]RAW13116.1 sugar ABC transporter permease [Phytoactinopolyspora halophila]